MNKFVNLLQFIGFPCNATKPIKLYISIYFKGHNNHHLLINFRTQILDHSYLKLIKSEDFIQFQFPNSESIHFNSQNCYDVQFFLQIIPMFDACNRNCDIQHVHCAANNTMPVHVNSANTQNIPSYYNK